MRLTHLHIQDFKNLKEVAVEFSDSYVPTAVIGNNGTGKSNLIEALAHIFLGLYFAKPVRFAFDIAYQAHGKKVNVQNDHPYEGYRITVNGMDWPLNRFKEAARNPGLSPPFPAMIFGYYSGTCKRLHAQFKRYNSSYAAKLRQQSHDLERSFIFSDISQARDILIALIAHGYKGLLNELSIGGLERVRISLIPPKQYDPEKDDPKFWGTQEAIRDFLADLDNVALEQESTSGFSPSGFSSGFSRRTYALDQDGLTKLGYWAERRGTTVYSLLQALGKKSMLINFECTLRTQGGGTHFDFDELSEGEKQLISVIGGIHLAQQDECLVLLDEPDTHLNPAWSWKFNSLLKQALNSQQSKSSMVLVATHDPVLISGLSKEQVLIAHQTDKGLQYRPPVRDPKGQGVANVLTSEFFGLPSSLDEATQKLLDQRLALAFKEGPLNDVDRSRLYQINRELEGLGMFISERDPQYAEYIRQLSNEQPDQ